MLVPHRTFSSPEYRYGFQGQEKDDEIKGNGNSINYKFRMHDPRVGRFFAVDPLIYDFPYNSPYAFSENRVIDAIEFEGLESMPMGYFHGLPSDVADEARRGFVRSTKKGAIVTGVVAIVVVDFVFLKGAITRTSGTVFTGLAMGDAYEMMQNTDKIHQAEKAGDFQRAMRLESKNLKLSENVVGEMFGGAIGIGIGKIFAITRKGKQIFRGTSNYLEIRTFDETGYILSDAARIRYAENGGDLVDALQHSDNVHKKWLEIFGSIEAYAEEHAKQGTKMKEIYGLDRTLISFSDEEAKAIYYSNGGAVFEGPLPENAHKQTLKTSTENEYLIINGTGGIEEVKNGG